MNKQRRAFCQASVTGCLLGIPAAALAADVQTYNDAITNMRTRRSVRAYSPMPVSEKDLHTILDCAMLAPSAANEQPWDYVVITDASILEKIPAINPYAHYVKTAPMAILVCLNEGKEKIPGMGIIDVSMSAQNILLAAHALGLGAVFTGIYPDKERIQGFRNLLGLPENVIPIGLIVLGKPETNEQKPVPERFQQSNVHMQKWSE